MSDQPALTLDGISVAFGGNLVLDNLSTSFDVGFTGLMGPNGAGKTTLLNVVCGFLAPDVGTVSLAGEHLNGLGAAKVARRGIARTFQTPRLIGNLTVLENTLLGFHRHYRAGHIREMFGSRVSRRNEREFQERALHLLKVFGLADFAYRDASALPLGSQKIVEVVRALVSQPRALLLDEPAAGLGARDVDALLAGLGDAVDSSKVVVVIIEHDMELITRLCPRASVLHFGRIIATGTPQSVLADPIVRDAYLGVEDAA